MININSVCLRKLLPIAVLLSFSLQAHAQLEWINFDRGTNILDMDQDGEDIWIGSYGGIVSLNKNTKEKNIYQAWNSPMPIKSIQDVLVDDFGNRWFASAEQGLVNYDNTDDWILYDEYNGLALMDVDNLNSDFSGGVWFSARYPNEIHHRVFHFNGVSFVDHPIATISSNFGVHEMSFTSDGSVWSNSASEIKKYNQVSIVKTYNYLFFGLSQLARFRNLTLDENNDPWIYSIENNSVYKLDPITGAWEVKFYIEEEKTTNIFTDESNNLWLEVQYFEPVNGFSRLKYYRFENDDWVEYLLQDFGQLVNSFGGGELHYIDQQGEAWLGQNISGQNYRQLFRATANTPVVYDHSIFPNTTSTTKDLILDCDQLYWFMDNTEIKKFDGSDWEGIDVLNGLGSFQSLAKHPSNCDVWVAARGNGLDVVQYNNDDIETYDLENIGISDIEIDGNIVYASIRNNIVKRIGADDWEYYNYHPDSADYHITMIEVGHNGNIWGAYRNLQEVFLFDGDQFSIFNEDNSPIDEDIDWFYKDPNGIMWMGNRKTYKYENGSWSIHPFVFSSGISGMDRDADGNYWISHEQKGLIFWNGGNVFAFYDITNSDIATNRILGVKVDGYDNKWLRQPRGTTFFNQNGLSFDHLPNSISIEGKVFIDTNENGIYDPNVDFGKAGEVVTLLPDNINTFTDQNGDYTFSPIPGNYEIIHDATGIYFPTSSESISIQFNHGSISEQNFGMWSNNFPQDINININSGFINCDQDFAVLLDIENATLNPIEGTAEISFPNDFDFVTGVPNDYQIDGNTISWNYNDLAPQQSKSYKIFLTAPGSSSTGNTFDFEANASAFYNGQLIDESSDITSGTINCVDPSLSKRSESSGPQFGVQTLIGDSLIYTIDFQNSQVETVSLLRIIDSLSNNLDPSSFKLLASSHPVSTNISNDGVIEFLFSNINLPTAGNDPIASKGFIKFAVLAKDLTPPLAVENTALLFFDFYEKIQTNTTNNVLVDIFNSTDRPKTVSFDAEIYPNPNDGSAIINVNHENPNQYWTACIVDISGKKVQQFNSRKALHQFEGIQSGFYLLVIELNDEIVTKKMIVH